MRSTLLYGWENNRLICCHGVMEGENDHTCPECRKLTDRLYGILYPTVLFLTEPQGDDK